MSALLARLNTKEQIRDTDLTELLDLLGPPDLLGLQRQLDDVEVSPVQIVRLEQVLLLHRLSDRAVLAVGAVLGVQQLVDDNVVGVDLVVCQLLDQPLRLVQREELGDGNADEGRLVLEAKKDEEEKSVCEGEYCQVTSKSDELGR
jgi:hypothetical protein